ncbi:hypothetical protein MA03_00280 [Infirmifilum uzonense]|uniref:Uncharacterized protein n=1 Tax=Infirmifilum uzonense TaxID=1550241 RepID=A0A0F7FH55_9CREN|nr:hypothetical protein MA03_00280 [Infirmifilum uzonense]
MGWRLAALVAAVLAVLAVLLVFPPSRQSGGQHGLQGGGVEAPRQVLVSATVLGQGSLALNGTPVSNSTLLLRPGVVSLEARPASGWRLKQLLVNGSPGVADWLRIRGNTSIAVVFEHVPVKVVVYSDLEGARAVVNGSSVALPAELEVPWGSVLVVEQAPVEGYEALNGTVTLRALGDVEVRLAYRKVRFVARFLNVLVPVKVNATGRVYAGNFTLAFNRSHTVAVEPYGVDDAGCAPFNQTHKVCLHGWLRRSTNETLRVRYLYVNLTGDEVFDQLQVYTKASYDAAVIEVLVGNTTVKTIAWPAASLMVVPFRAEYEYVGNGWFHVKGDDWGFYIKMPPWRRIRVYVNYTAVQRGGGEIVGRIAVVVCNGPVYLDIGTAYGSIPLTAFTIDRRIVEVYDAALKQYNYDRRAMDVFFGYEREFQKYFLCYNLVENYQCSPGKTMAGPSTKIRPSWVSQGDLEFDGSGEAWIKIEILE